MDHRLAGLGGLGQQRAIGGGDAAQPLIGKGIVGIGMWPEVGATTVEEGAEAFAAAYAILSAPEFVAERRAVDPDYNPFDHLAFGSDFDGAVTTPIDIGGLPALTGALLAYRAPDGSRLFDEAAIRKIAGLNACRVFAERLPGGSAERASEICGTLGKGFDRADARRMAEQTFIGAAALLEASDEEPAELRRRVTSPKGTTERAVTVLQDAQLDAVFAEATDAALARAAELAAGA